MQRSGRKKDIRRAWLHHKGRNKHHFEYWIDFSKTSQGLSGAKMPVNYLVEMVMDRIAASRVYRGAGYTDGAAWEYYQMEQPYLSGIMHPETQAELEKILIMLDKKGERVTFAYLRKLLKRELIKEPQKCFDDDERKKGQLQYCSAPFLVVVRLAVSWAFKQNSC